MDDHLPPTTLVEKLERLIRSRLWLQILVGMALGIGVGLALSPSGAAVLSEPNARLVACWLALPGHVYTLLHVTADNSQLSLTQVCLAGARCFPPCVI